MKRFREWVEVRESLVTGVTDKVMGVLSRAAKTASWGVTHPQQVPPELWHRLIQKYQELSRRYGPVGAALIVGSLVISLGPGLAVPGSILLFWTTLGAVKLFNTIYSRLDHQDISQSPPLDGGLLRREVEALRQEISRWASELPASEA